MREWSLSFIREAEQDFRKLDHAYRKGIVQKLNRLVKNFDTINPLPLTGKWHGFFKLRIGNWRIIYHVNHEDLLLVVYAIGRRDKIYRK
jgi:mRNA interferase RelE/StbE